MSRRILGWTFIMCLIALTLTAMVANFIVGRGNGNEKTIQVMSHEQQLTRNTLVAEGMATRTVFSNGVAELKTALKEASSENVAAHVASANSVNMTLETESLKVQAALTKLQNATVEGLTAGTAQAKENGEAFKANTTNLEALLAETAKKNADIARLESELALLKVNPVTVATEAPAIDDKTHDVVLSMVSNETPRVQTRGLEKVASATDGWKHIPAGAVFYCSPQDIVFRRVEVDDSSGLIAMSFTGWPSRKFLGRFPVGDKVKVVDGARSVGLMHPTRNWEVRVNK
jgi:hypothetical protein